jgi:hypothetical protein
MKHTFDIREEPIGVSRIEPRSILFAGYHQGLVEFNGHSDATMITEIDRPGNMGCLITSSNGEVSVSSVEHARKLIQALEFAIQNEFLFTGNQLRKHLKVNDSRVEFKKKLRN